ncbi:cyclic nucleotide-binding domain-containing protein [Streptomyces rishiriensis]|uniref:cyclic nucleotide-binding domain-containing protein n=1 Tax=Streptomyces rishiriensis TaxID=68264 RepID=UPI000D591C53|nr:cyclic nucleotide-binding domain-containing protein [Streptomyces rishiriensis]
MALTDRTQPFLYALARPLREDLLRLGSERPFAAGEHLMRESEPGRNVVVLLDGWSAVSISTGRSSYRLLLALRGPGELVGEMAMVDGSPRSATVTGEPPTSRCPSNRPNPPRRRLRLPRRPCPPQSPRPPHSPGPPHPPRPSRRTGSPLRPHPSAPAWRCPPDRTAPLPPFPANRTARNLRGRRSSSGRRPFGRRSTSRS